MQCRLGLIQAALFCHAGCAANLFPQFGLVGVEFPAYRLSAKLCGPGARGEVVLSTLLRKSPLTFSRGGLGAGPYRFQPHMGLKQADAS